MHQDIEVVAEVERIDDVLPALTGSACDILLLDLQMDRSGLESIESFARMSRVVVVTASERLTDALVAVRAGARAFVQKRYAIDTLISAIRAVADGFVWMPPPVQAALTAQWTEPANTRLTARE